MFIRRVFAVLLALALSLALAAPVSAITFTRIEGIVSDAGTAMPLQGVCVKYGPGGAGCPSNVFTDAMGKYVLESVPDGTMSQPIQTELFFIKDGYTTASLKFNADGTGPYLNKNFALQAEIATMTVYLPNITKTLGGANGWYTPFIVQNVSTDLTKNTKLGISFYKFSDGALVKSITVDTLAPGRSYSLDPRDSVKAAGLPDNAQFSVVIKSFGAPIVAVVNEHQGDGTSGAEAGSYAGASSGAPTVFLPNITRRFFGFNTPFIIQNLGTATTTVTASFQPFDNDPAKKKDVNRTIAPGRSQAIDPNFEPGLTDGTQYAVTVTASNATPISVVVNTHRDDPAVTTTPVMYSTNGLTSGAATVHGPYAVKNRLETGKGISTIVVQNLGATPVSPSLTFTQLSGGSTTTFTGPTVAPKSSWAWDPRYVNGEAGAGKPQCGSLASAGCLADGEYSFTANAPGGSLAAVVNVIWEGPSGPQTANGYSAVASTSATLKSYLPNVTKTLGGTNGWTTPIILQSITATSATLTWYRFSDGAALLNQGQALAPGIAVRVDPRSLNSLPGDMQFAVKVEANGTVVAIVHELNFGPGDGAMTYEGFAQ